MTEQGTPTATDDLAAVIRFVDGDHTKGAGAIAEAVVALGWKSPAEVAELVQTTSQRVWKEGALWAAVETGAIGSVHEKWLVSEDNPYMTRETR